MKGFSNLLFDFDGTLFDTSPGVFASFRKVTEHYGMEIEQDIYNKMIGPPLSFTFKNFYKLPDNEIENAIKLYKKYYEAEGMYNCVIYDGVVELIKKCRAQGKMICVATSKPELLARKILERNGMLELFDFVGGSDMEEKFRVSKVDVVNYVLKNQGLENRKAETLMIGDRYFDVEGSHAAGLKCLGILWGFGDRKEFQEHNADFICETPEDVWEFLS